MSKKVFIVLIIVIALVLGFIICQLVKPQKEHHAGPAPKISIGMQDNVFPALVWIAKGAGYFKEQDLDVELKKYPSGKLALAGLFNDEVELCTTADTPIMANSFTRDDYLVLATVGTSDSAIWIIARKDMDINDPEDLRGKRIATQKNSAAHFFMSMFLLYNQIDESEVDISYLAAVDLPQALIDGDIDAFSIRNPFIQQAKDGLGDKTIEFFGSGIYRNTFNLVGKKDYVEQNPELMKRVLAAVIKAGELVKNNKDQAIAITTRELGPGREQEVASDWNNYTFRVSLDQSLITTMEDEARWAIKNNFTEATEVPNYLDYIYMDGLKAIKPEAVGIIH